MKNIICIYLLLTPFYFYAQFGPEIIITTENPSTWSVFLTDIDGDNYLDLLASEEVNNKLIWYKNLDGLGTFGEEHIITLGLEYTRYVTAADIDGDGDMDVLSTSGSSDLVVWYENLDGLGNFGAQQIISDNVLLPKMVVAYDIDGDNDLDVIVASRADNKITWYESTDGQGTFGPQQIINNNAQAVASVFIADIDGDGDGDVVSDSSSNGFPCWYENLDGLGNFGPQQEITNDTSGSIYTIADDLDNDGDMDIVGLEFGGNTIAWYENTDGLGTFGAKQIITTDVYAPRLFVTADFDNDGDQDIVYNSQASLVEKIAWFENLTILGVTESLQLKISLHPNPANSLINISNTSNYNIKQITIYNLLGKQVKQVKGNVSQIIIADLATGVYFVNLETERGSVTKKLMKE